MRVYAAPDSMEKCPVRLLDFYLSKLPEKPATFHMRPLEKIPSQESRPWYCKSRVGINKFKTFMPEICSDSGLGLRYTNHSLRATAVTRMFNTGVPEKVIAEKSGHRSLKALRAYERTSVAQEMSAGRCIQLPGQDFSTSVTQQVAVQEVAIQEVSTALTGYPASMPQPVNKENVPPVTPTKQQKRSSAVFWTQ